MNLSTLIKFNLKILCKIGISLLLILNLDYPLLETIGIFKVALISLAVGSKLNAS